jgi:hypothetical protein
MIGRHCCFLSGGRPLPKTIVSPHENKGLMISGSNSEYCRGLFIRTCKVDADYRERTLEAEEHPEEAVVSKEACVVEEIGLRKASDTHQESISDTIRHTEVEVDDERSRPAPG